MTWVYFGLVSTPLRTFLRIPKEPQGPLKGASLARRWPILSVRVIRLLQGWELFLVACFLSYYQTHIVTKCSYTESMSVLCVLLSLGYVLLVNGQYLSKARGGQEKRSIDRLNQLQDHTANISALLLQAFVSRAA